MVAPPPPPPPISEIRACAKTLPDSDAARLSESPDGSRIVFEAFVAEQESYDLFLIDADGSDRVRLTDLPGAELNPSWSQDGTRIVFQYLPPDYTYWGPVKSEVYVIHADGANPWGP
jgi:Tol biopolymer transport system component